MVTLLQVVPSQELIEKILMYLSQWTHMSQETVVMVAGVIFMILSWVLSKQHTKVVTIPKVERVTAINTIAVLEAEKQDLLTNPEKAQAVEDKFCTALVNDAVKTITKKENNVLKNLMGGFVKNIPTILSVAKEVSPLWKKKK